MELQKYCDKRGVSGYGSALLYKEPNESLYHLLIPLETVPSVFGSVDTFETDILTCTSKGRIEGKESIEQTDVEFLWHRDNVKKLESLQGRVLDFMAVYGKGTWLARTFTATLKVRPNEAGADVMRGRFTLTPMSANVTTILDCRDLIQDTITFGQIPDNLVIDAEGYSVEISTDPAKTATTITATSDNEKFTAQVTAADETKNAVVKITCTETETQQYGIITIKATAKGYASWETTIAVENVKSAD